MMTPIASLLNIAPQIDVFFIDVFGVLWDGTAFYPEALRICQKLIEMGKRIYILSNTTMVGSHFKEKHIPHGFIQNVHYTDVISSGDVFKFHLEHNHFLDKITGSDTSKYLLVGRSNDQLLESVLSRQTYDPEEADAMYIGSLQTKTPSGYTEYDTVDLFTPLAWKALYRNLPAICANPDYFAFTKDFKHVTQGSLGKWYEDHGGKVYWFGKPYSNIYDYALKFANTSPEKCAMIGDTIRTDILGGYNAGMKTILVLKYGITQDKINAGETLEDIAAQEGAMPDFTINGLQ